jgi:hypothetical protein
MQQAKANLAWELPRLRWDMALRFSVSCPCDEEASL